MKYASPFFWRCSRPFARPALALLPPLRPARLRRGPSADFLLADTLCFGPGAGYAGSTHLLYYFLTFGTKRRKYDYLYIVVKYTLFSLRQKGVAGEAPGPSADAPEYLRHMTNPIAGIPRPAEIYAGIVK